MSIWFNKNITLADFAHFGKNTMGEFLEMQFTEISDDFLKMTMPINNKTKQRMVCYMAVHRLHWLKLLAAWHLHLLLILKSLFV